MEDRHERVEASLSIGAWQRVLVGTITVLRLAASQSLRNSNSDEVIEDVRYRFGGERVTADGCDRHFAVGGTTTCRAVIDGFGLIAPRAVGVGPHQPAIDRPARSGGSERCSAWPTTCRLRRRRDTCAARSLRCDAHQFVDLADTDPARHQRLTDLREVATHPGATYVGQHDRGGLIGRRPQVRLGRFVAVDRGCLLVQLGSEQVTRAAARRAPEPRARCCESVHRELRRSNPHTPRSAARTWRYLSRKHTFDNNAETRVSQVFSAAGETRHASVLAPRWIFVGTTSCDGDGPCVEHPPTSEVPGRAGQVARRPRRVHDRGVAACVSPTRVWRELRREAIVRQSNRAVRVGLVPRNAGATRSTPERPGEEWRATTPVSMSDPASPSSTTQPTGPRRSAARPHSGASRDVVAGSEAALALAGEAVARVEHSAISHPWRASMMEDDRATSERLAEVGQAMALRGSLTGV